MTTIPLFPWILIDLTQQLTTKSIGYAANTHCTITRTLDYDQCQSKTKFRVQEIKMPLGIGTHIDSPAHANPKGKTIEQIPLEDLFLPLILIDCRATINKKNLKITPKPIEEFEKTYGQIPPNSCVFMYTGWAQKWDNPIEYRNEQIDKKLQYPTLSNETIDLLIQRNISGLAIDTLSPDTAPQFYAHEQLLSSNIIIIENLGEPHNIPSYGSFIGIFPLKIAQATESPARVIAFVPKQ